MMDHADGNPSSSDPHLQSDDPEIMALLFNTTTTGQSSDLPTIHSWQDHAHCYNSSYESRCYNPNQLYQCPHSFGEENGPSRYGGGVDGGCYSFYGDLNEPHVDVVPTNNGSTAFMPMDFFTIDEKNSTDDSHGDVHNSPQVPEEETLSPLPQKHQHPKKTRKTLCESPNPSKKKPHASKKAKKGATKEHSETEECNNNNINNNNNNTYLRQNSISGSSEEDSATSQEINGGILLDPSSSSKAVSGVTTNAQSNAAKSTRPRQVSATDPQSLYARKRRERINERLRILQKLVPNGTKVDISTMLEEAVQYVKFLQLQIKLLSSDDLWMYAPIAYNGKDIGLDHIKIGDFGGRS